MGKEAAFWFHYNKPEAHKWIREEGDGELFQRYDRAAVPGVSFHVEFLDIPTKRGA